MLNSVFNIAVRFFDGNIKKERKTKRTNSNYILNIAFDAFIPKKRWKKQALILITTNHAILVALVECLSRNWFVYVSRRAFNKRIRYISSRNTSSRNSRAFIYTSHRYARKVRKSPVEKSKYKLPSFLIRSAWLISRSFEEKAVEVIHKKLLQK